MAQERGQGQHDGFLIEGADGSLWFMRDDANAPVQLRGEVLRRISELLEREPQRELSGLSPEVVKILAAEFGPIVPWGALHLRTRRLPR
jgi:hypothetical protein